MDSPKENIRVIFKECFEFIENNIKNGNVYVHCYMGISRSATIVIAYLMKTKKWDLKKALEYVKSKRSKVNPNRGFLMTLN